MADSSPPRQVSQIKMRFSFFFDALRHIPTALQSHAFSVSMSSRGDKHFAVSPKFTANQADQTADNMSNIGVNFVHHYECTMLPLATRQSYKPHTVRIQVTDHDTNRIIVDAEVNLADWMRNEKVPMTKLNVKALEPPTILVLSLVGMSLEAYKKQQVEQAPAPERRADTAPTAAAEPIEAHEEEAAPHAHESKPRAAWLERAEYEETAAPANSAAADVGQRKERDDHAAKNDDALGLEGGSEVPTQQQHHHNEHHEQEKQEATVVQEDEAAHRNREAAPSNNNNDGGSQTHTSGAAKAPAGKGGVKAKPTPEAIAAANAADAERRQRERRARGEVRRHEYERRYGDASVALQQQVRAILDDIKDNILKPTRLDVDGVKCSVPRAALRATTALVQFADHALTAPVAVDRENWDSDDDGNIPDTTPVLPREAGLLLFVHDLIVMLRWDICPALLDPRHTGAWLHTLLHLLNSTLQTYLSADVTSLLPVMTQTQLMADQNPDGPKIGLVGDTRPVATSRSRRRWWRSLRIPRAFRRTKQQKEAVAADEDSVLIPGGGRSILSDDSTFKERAMGLLNRYSASLHAAATELDTMWGLHHERLVAPTAQRKPTITKSGDTAAFPLLCTLPTQIFWPVGTVAPAAHAHMAASPLLNLLRDAFERHIPTTTARPTSVFTSEYMASVQGIMATLALELDMALHDLLCQCAQSHVDALADLAFSAMAPVRDDRGVAITVAVADGSEIRVGPGGSEAAAAWLLKALEGVYGELIASSADAGQTVDRSYMWDSPLSVAATSEIVALCLEQLSVACLNENHRRIARNMSPVSAKEAKKDKNNTATAKRWNFAPLTPDGCNVDGLLVLCSADDGLFLKARLDAIEKWIDHVPVPLSPACRAALLPLRSLCDALILPSEVFLKPHIRLEALLGVPNAMQRAIFAAYRDAPWEHPDDAAVGFGARNDLVATHLCPPPHHPLLPGQASSAPAEKAVGPWSDPDAVALPFAAVFRSVDRDFSFLDLVTLPSPYFGSLENIDHALKRQPELLAEQIAKGVQPHSADAFTKVELLYTQLLNSFRGQRQLRNSTIARGSTVTALWDTNGYRSSIGLSLEEHRREEQLFDPRRGADAYVAPKTTLQPLLGSWDHTDVASERKAVCKSVSDALLSSVKRS